MKIILLLFLTLPAVGQEDTVANIDAYGTDIENQLKQCETKTEDSFLCGMYLDEITVNLNHSPWRAVGHYQKRTRFWYTDDPKNCPGCTNGIEIMLKADLQEYISVYTYRREFFFNQGVLVLAKRSADEVIENFYFSNGRLIRYQSNSKKTVESGSDEVSNILMQAADLQRIFLSLHE